MLKDTKYLKDLGAHWLQRRKDARKGRPLTRRGRGEVNECWRPSAGASKADLAEYHREEMALRSTRSFSTYATRWLVKNPKHDFRNYSRHPGGKKRTRAPVYL